MYDIIHYFIHMKLLFKNTTFQTPLPGLTFGQSLVNPGAQDNHTSTPLAISEGRGVATTYDWTPGPTRSDPEPAHCSL